MSRIKYYLFHNYIYMKKNHSIYVMIETSKLLLVELIVFKYDISTKSQRHLRFEAEYFFCSFSNTHLGSPPSIMAYIYIYYGIYIYIYIYNKQFLHYMVKE
jgi:hypothetical protein